MFYSNQQGRGQKGVRQSQLSGFLWRPIHEFILDQCSEEQQQQFRAASATGRGTAKQWLLVARPEFRSEIGNYVTNLCLVFNMKVPSLPPLHFFHPFIHPPFNPPPHRRHRHRPPAQLTALCCCYAICWCTRQSTR